MIILNQVGSATAYFTLYKPDIDRAVALWNRILIYYDQTGNDIIIDFTFEFEDNNTLGWASPTSFDVRLMSNPTSIQARAVSGEMHFNTKWYTLDTTSENYKMFFPTVVHEMAHVIGFGSLWNMRLADYPSLQAQIQSVSPPHGALTYMNDVLDHNDSLKYVGAKALECWRKSIPGHENDTYIPLENEGGSGSVGSHWDESAITFTDYRGRLFKDELMTATQGVADEHDFMSFMTIASLQDIGYDVSLKDRWLGVHRYDMIYKGAI